MSESPATRREFISGKAALERVRGGLELPEAPPDAPAGGDTIRLTAQAMACDFSVIMNGGATENVMHASDALHLVSRLEQQMSVYRANSELSLLNRAANGEAAPVETGLFELLWQCRRLHDATWGASDPTSGPLLSLWRDCRAAGRIPTGDEVEQRLAVTGMRHVEFDEADHSVRITQAGAELDLGGIGKGHALDRAYELLESRGIDECLLHGGHSSMLARGDHNGQGGWPVGIGNPLFTKQRLGTLLLRDCAMSTSGSNIQYFRHQGRRYGHILDPRTGWPVETMLSVTVLAPTAAEADALSTAFFVLGVEKTTQCCDNLDGVGAILIPFPETGRRVRPTVLGVPGELLFWDASQVAV